MKCAAVQKSKLFHQLNRPYIILPCEWKQNFLFQNGKKKRKQPVHNFDRSCQGGFTQFYRTSLRQVCPAWKNINPATGHAAAAQTCSRPEPDPSSPPPRFPGQERGWRRATPIPPPPAAAAAAGDPLRPSPVRCPVPFSIAAPLSVSLSWRRRLGERRRGSPRLPWRVLCRRQVPTRCALPFSSPPVVRKQSISIPNVSYLYSDLTQLRDIHVLSTY